MNLRESLLLYADNVLLYNPIRSNEDFLYLEEDIDKLSVWSLQKLTTVQLSIL